MLFNAANGKRQVNRTANHKQSSHTKTMDATTTKLFAFLKVPFVALWMLSHALTCQLLKWLGRSRITTYLSFHRGMRRFFNLHSDISGTMETSPNTLYVSNHISYLDVFVLGAEIPASFIAKSEVSGWPVFGKLAACQDTLFLKRKSSYAASQVSQLRARLNQDSLILFPEGTSTPGTMIEPFRSTLFAASDRCKIQPVTVAYTHYDGDRMNQKQRDRYAWYLPMPFLSHFIYALGLKRAGAQIVFHEPVTLDEFESRKACAKHCEQVVRAGLLKAIAESEETAPTHYLAAVGRA